MVACSAGTAETQQPSFPAFSPSAFGASSVSAPFGPPCVRGTLTPQRLSLLRVCHCWQSALVVLGREIWPLGPPMPADPRAVVQTGVELADAVRLDGVPAGVVLLWTCWAAVK